MDFDKYMKAKEASEARRELYVAVSRPQSLLHLVYAKPKRSGAGGAGAEGRVTTEAVMQSLQPLMQAGQLQRMTVEELLVAPRSLEVLLGR